MWMSTLFSARNASGISEAKDEYITDESSSLFYLNIYLAMLARETNKNDRIWVKILHWKDAR